MQQSLVSVENETVAYIETFDNVNLETFSGDGEVLCENQNHGGTFDMDQFNTVPVTSERGEQRMMINGDEVCAADDLDHGAGRVGLCFDGFEEDILDVARVVTRQN